MKKRNNFATLKYNAVKLRANYQLPFQLVYYISQLGEDSSIEWVNYLKTQTEHMLRIKGYYSRYKPIEDEFNRIIKAEYERRFK